MSEETTLTVVSADAPRVRFDMESGRTRVLMCASAPANSGYADTPPVHVGMRWTAKQVDDIIDALTKLRAAMKE